MINMYRENFSPVRASTSGRFFPRSNQRDNVAATNDRIAKRVFPRYARGPAIPFLSSIDRRTSLSISCKCRPGDGSFTIGTKAEMCRVPLSREIKFISVLMPFKF